MITSSSFGTSVSLNNCDREPVHTPGSIQEHGFLVCVRTGETSVSLVSKNINDFLGIAPTEYLGKSIFSLLDPEDHDFLKGRLAAVDVSAENPIKLGMITKNGIKRFDCLISQLNGFTSFEFEPSQNQSDFEFKSFYLLSTKAIERLRAAESLPQLLQMTVDEIRRITNFDRVVVYEFDPKWNGHVVSEAKSATASSYLDLHFPASDIPKQVRELYSINPIRVIPSVNYKSSPLVSFDPKLASTIDLSLVSLRNVSPIHIEYLHNMQVTASMSVSVFNRGQLWGLISCSNEVGSNPISYEKGAVCKFIAATVTSLLPFLENRDDSVLRTKLQSIQNSLVKGMSEANRFTDGLFANSTALMDLTNSTGVAAFVDGEWQAQGSVPSIKVLDEIKALVMERSDSLEFHTDKLSDLIEISDEVSEVASGVMGFSISRSNANFIFWFRPEFIQTVKWGGNPNKPVEVQDGVAVLHPRKSFELWKETVKAKSLPWRKEELEIAQTLRSSIMDIVLQRVEQVTKLNIELERSNNELDSFAYAASHDLKEPLRGISNYAEIVLRETENILDKKNRDKLETIVRLTQRAESLISSLLNYSQIGRSELLMEKVELKSVVSSAVDNLKSIIETTNTEIEILNLPIVLADKIQLTSVFTNLISNAIKYNENTQRRIRIFELDNQTMTPDSNVIVVEDNGIGIPERFTKSIFKIFRRLHSRDAYGGGTGTGLTIVKSIVERHGGSISVESKVKVGTKFLITFPRIKDDQ